MAVLFLLVVFVLSRPGWAIANPDQSPRIIEYSATAGPDGPWNAISQSVSWPNQNVTMFPSFTISNLVVEAAACSGQDTACPPSDQASMWSGQLSSWSWMNSTSFQASGWDNSLEPLNLTGRATLISDRVTLEETGRNDVYLDFVANAIDQSFTVNYPSSDYWYTMTTGLLSLNGASETVNWTSVNGSDVALYHTLPLAYKNGAIPSISYGLHIGSASQKIPGSLVLGGYDRSRCLTQPIQSINNTFTLIDIGLGVAQGASPFSTSQDPLADRMLRLNGSELSSIYAYPNPGVPYLHLPHDTCSAIAEHLPVTFDEGRGLYLWNVSDPTFSKIVSSPSYLSFTFDSGTKQNSTIYVPFALLNLTLDNPLVSVPTQYFPCSPYTPSDGSTFHLGRAFLQAAFISQNWQTQSLMLAQAPGPSFSLQDVVTIASNDTIVTPMINPPSWSSTWSSTLTVLSGSADGGATADTSSDSKAAESLSSGAIAGIAVGVTIVVVFMAISGFLVVRRKRAKVARDELRLFEKDEQFSFDQPCPSHTVDWAAPIEMESSGRAELEPKSPVVKGYPIEMASSERAELDSRGSTERHYPIEMDARPVVEIGSSDIYVKR